MRISVIIPTFNRGGRILGTLEGLCKQSLPTEQFEVVIADDASTDDTRERVDAFLRTNSLTGWRCMSLANNGGRAAAINAGALAATGDVILCTDDDIVPVPTWVERHLGRHEGHNAPVAVVGSVVYPDEWIRRSNLVRFHNSTYLGTEGNRVTTRLKKGHAFPLSHFAGGNCSLSRRVLIDAGMFNEHMRRGQDGELAFRLARRGVQFVFEPRAKVVHYADAASSYPKWLSAFKRYYVENVPFMLERYPDEYHQFGHWFLERPAWRKESLKRSLVKQSVRVLARPVFGRVLARVLQRYDHLGVCYRPMLYKYLLACTAIEAINERPKEPKQK